METPNLQAQHKKREKLAGEWIGGEKIQPSEWSPNGGTARCTFDSRMAAGGFFLVSDDVHKEGSEGMNLCAHAIGAGTKSSRRMCHIGSTPSEEATRGAPGTATA